MITWKPDDFVPTVTDSGARKLSESAVAPLVAAARPYGWLERPAVKPFLRQHAMVSTSKAARQLQECARDGVMTMPWYRLDRVIDATGRHCEPSFDALQYRPTSPRVFDDGRGGRAAKYEMRYGDPSVIDVHPATPRSWFEPGGVAQVMVTEGLLKADSAVSAMLASAGVDRDALAWHGPVDEARKRLREAMEAVPSAERTMVVALVGVGNWHRNALELSALPLKGARVVLAFDADAETNINVWTQLARLSAVMADRGVAEVSRVDLSDANLQDVAAGGKGKLGIDDALARYVEWRDLVAWDQLLRELPERPKDDVLATPGAWRVVGDTDEVPAGTRTQVCVEVKDEFGGNTLHWEDRFPFGGRLAELTSTRSPTRVEIESGVFERDWTAEQSPELTRRATVEVGWVDPVTGEARQTAITGAAKSLMFSEPKDWGRPSLDVDLPMDAFTIPGFPPTKQGREWLDAIRRHRAVETRRVAAWDTLGWVPVPGSPVCAFIAGNQIIGPGGDRVRSAVSETDLPGASRFGVAVPDGDPLSDVWKEQVRQSVRRLYEAYVFSGVWADPGTAAVVLAAGLRPFVPLHTHSVVYLQGPPGKGKSWTAAAIASFHQARPGAFDNNSLPAGANSTAYATEIAVSKANLWIIDDIAPTLDRRKADEQASKIADLIRAIHNSASRQRGNGAGGLAKTRQPKALLVLTAENDAQLRSVRDRTLEVTFGDGSLDGGEDGLKVERVSGFRDTDPAPAMVAGALVQWLQHAAVADPGGWAGMIDRFRQLRANVEAQYRNRMQDAGVNPANVARKAKIGADLGIGLQALLFMMEEVGGLNREIAATTANGEDTLYTQLGDLTASNALGQQRRSPGVTLVGAVRGMLMSGEAYLDSAAGDGTPPLGGDDPAGNAQLGWVRTPEGEWRPRGRSMIGVVTEAPSGSDERVALIMLKPTASLAARFDPSIGHGSDGTTVFRNLYSERLVHPHWQGHLADTGRVSVQVRRSSTARVRGVPVRLSLILDSEEVAE